MKGLLNEPDGCVMGTDTPTASQVSKGLIIPACAGAACQRTVAPSKHSPHPHTAIHQPAGRPGCAHGGTAHHGYTCWHTPFLSPEGVLLPSSLLSWQPRELTGVGEERGDETRLWLTIHPEGQALLPYTLCPKYRSQIYEQKKLGRNLGFLHF